MFRDRQEKRIAGGVTIVAALLVIVFFICISSSLVSKRVLNGVSKLTV